jgi:hypothetical protein
MLVMFCMLTSTVQEHGRLCDLGGFFQDQEEHHEVPRCYGRLRLVVKSLFATFPLCSFVVLAFLEP